MGHLFQLKIGWAYYQEGLLKYKKEFLSKKRCTALLSGGKNKNRVISIVARHVT